MTREMILPEVRGRLTARQKLSDLTWLRVGGPADWLFKPADLDDLRHRTRLVRITGAGLRESHPHDITVLRDE